MLQYRRVAKVAADASVEAEIETDGQQKSFFCYFWDRGERKERKKVSPNKIFFSRQRC